MISCFDSKPRCAFTLNKATNLENVCDALNAFGLLSKGYFWTNHDYLMCRNEYLARLVKAHKDAFMRRVNALASAQPNGDATVIFRAESIRELSDRYDALQNLLDYSFEIWMDSKENAIYCCNPVLAAAIKEDATLSKYGKFNHLWQTNGGMAFELYSDCDKAKAQQCYNELQSKCNNSEALVLEQPQLEGDGKWRVFCLNPILAKLLRDQNHLGCRNGITII